jgi:hypothetical protein
LGDETVMTEAEYEATMKRIKEILDAKPGSPEESELMRLVDQVEAYEDKYHQL